jgi:hypothetical protein
MSIEMGGAMVTEETLESPQKHMIGSTLLYRADSSAEVRKIVEADIYYKAGVVRIYLSSVHQHDFRSWANPFVRSFQWDPEQLVIVPFVEPPAHK